MISQEVTYFQTFRLWSESSLVIFISKISKHWIKHCTYEPCFGIGFGNMRKKNCKKSKFANYRWKNYITVLHSKILAYNYMIHQLKISIHFFIKILIELYEMKKMKKILENSVHSSNLNQSKSTGYQRNLTPSNS